MSSQMEPEKHNYSSRSEAPIHISKVRPEPPSGPILGPGTKLLLCGGMVLWSVILAFNSPLISWLQGSFLAAMFGLGLAGVASFVLPGKVKFKRAGITAVGGMALFLALLFWFKSENPENKDDVPPPPLSMVFLVPPLRA